MQKAIVLNNISKDYKLYKKNSDILKEFFSSKVRHTTKRALNNISFSVDKGETFGVLGSNGSGKSTVLQIINGTTFPTSGTVTTNGTVSLLNVNAGMLSSYTGMENIYYKCGILGLNKKQIDARLESIIEFSEVREFINQPLKKYSSGMKAKLGFSIAIHVNPDILIVDEALAVGDQMFKEKCYSKIDELQEMGVTILFVSHNQGQIKRVCDRACWIQQGELIVVGDAVEVGELYQSFVKKKKTLAQIKQELKEKNNELS